jgi:hypothetical protein
LERLNSGTPLHSSEIFGLAEVKLPHVLANASRRRFLRPKMIVDRPREKRLFDAKSLSSADEMKSLGDGDSHEETEMTRSILTPSWVHSCYLLATAS